MIVYCTVRWSRKGTDYHCHCEPVRTLVWQSVLQRLRFLSFSVQSARAKGETDCHVAALLAMTVVDGTQAEPTYVSTINDHFPADWVLTKGSFSGYNNQDIKKSEEEKSTRNRPVREPCQVRVGTVADAEHGLGAGPSIGRRFRIAPVTAF